MADAQIVDIFDESKWGEDERRYFSIIDQACEEKRDALLSNGQPGHAAYIIYKFLTNAQEEVQLFSGRLRCSLEGVAVYGNPRIIEAAITFLQQPGRTLSVLLEEEIDVTPGGDACDHPLVQAVQEAKAQGQIQGVLRVYQGLKDFIDMLKESNFNYHWMVMDKQAYRLENDTQKATAFVNFGDTQRAARLSHLFDSIANQSRVLCEI